MHSHWHRFSLPGHIRDGRHISGARYVDLELGFQSWLVEAWERAARLCCLELRGSDPSARTGNTFGKRASILFAAECL